MGGQEVDLELTLALFVYSTNVSLFGRAGSEPGVTVGFICVLDSPVSSCLEDVLSQETLCPSVCSDSPTLCSGLLQPRLPPHLLRPSWWAPSISCSLVCQWIYTRIISTVFPLLLGYYVFLSVASHSHLYFFHSLESCSFSRLSYIFVFPPYWLLLVTWCRLSDSKK